MNLCKDAIADDAVVEDFGPLWLIPFGDGGRSVLHLKSHPYDMQRTSSDKNITKDQVNTASFIDDHHACKLIRDANHV